MSAPILAITGLTKTYESGHQALKGIDLEIRRGEIFALLGPNGAGKTTLIGAVCGLVRPTGGTIRVNGLDAARDWRSARARIGLVPQELSTDMFETVANTVAFSRGLFGKPRDDAAVERVLRALSLWEKRGAKIMQLSGGMKRRVLIAKALAHDPELLFLDEPSAGVDVELRREMWAMILKLRDQGVTIILTTHYIEEAEEMADRIGVIDKGKLILVEPKADLLGRLGKTEATITLAKPIEAIPAQFADWPLAISDDGLTLTYTITAAEAEQRGLAPLVKALDAAGMDFKALDTHRSSLEDIFVDLVEGRA
ncbi:ABC-2 type transport system ATP-binding protein [Sphingomonas vulcanisoli]|uniref:ABC-2 type transport system ATP-binding protein n=1 Tax=Sphingomonas vulcanisoli TaxID=1658060 RepID=A0ABX0TUW3_9SPHN|nr:ABC transporter ATP-binding protein [Sphingomonas vulcanisoli]NIJ08255.1 ABC-2 type transport system ATP-binding protein [Sphingomonas vulcanisoli]